MRVVLNSTLGATTFPDRIALNSIVLGLTSPQECFELCLSNSASCMVAFWDMRGDSPTVGLCRATNTPFADLVYDEENTPALFYVAAREIRTQPCMYDEYKLIWSLNSYMWGTCNLK